MSLSLELMLLNSENDLRRESKMKNFIKNQFNNNNTTRFEKYLFHEIGIEFKACLYFYAITFFYCCFNLLIGKTSVSILYLAEIIASTYIFGYLQIYALGGVDESNELGIREIFCILLCSSIYALESYIFKWFNQSILATVIFYFYMLLCYFCAYLVYSIRREIDEKMLNEDLQNFQSREK